MRRFKPGDTVRVRVAFPRRGHIRTPFYIRGKSGRIERVCGDFHNPEHLAYGIPAITETLYRVRFDQAHVWPDYRGRRDDTVDIEIYEHWLAPAGEGVRDGARSARPRPRPRSRARARR
jgi:nitrile hydratase